MIPPAISTAMSQDVLVTSHNLARPSMTSCMVPRTQKQNFVTFRLSGFLNAIVHSQLWTTNHFNECFVCYMQRLIYPHQLRCLVMWRKFMTWQSKMLPKSCRCVAMSEEGGSAGNIRFSGSQGHDSHWLWRMELPKCNINTWNCCELHTWGEIAHIHLGFHQVIIIFVLSE